MKGHDLTPEGSFRDALCPMPCPEELLSNRADVVASEVVIRRRPYLQALDCFS